MTLPQHNRPAHRALRLVLCLAVGSVIGADFARSEAPTAIRGEWDSAAPWSSGWLGARRLDHNIVRASAQEELPPGRTRDSHSILSSSPEATAERSFRSAADGLDGQVNMGDACEGDCERGPFLPGWFRHAGRGDPGRHIGLGDPLEGTSWLNRPWHVDYFAGGLFTDTLIRNRVDPRDGFFSGVRLGEDFDHYWGWELRYQTASMAIATTAAGEPAAAYDYMVDMHLNYYPWGDARWRPYASLGLGLSGFHFTDNLGRQIDQSLLEIPLGVGMKYFMTKNWTLRCDLTDHLAIGAAELQTMHNVSLTAGVEWHFGAVPTSYYPWNPSIHLW